MRAAKEQEALDPVHAPIDDALESAARAGDRFGAGAAPAALEELGTDGDSREEELKQKVKALVDTTFGGSYQAAFDHYAGGDHKIGADELAELLSDIDFANWAIRKMAVGRIIAKLDRDGDKKIAWPEFEAQLKA